MTELTERQISVLEAELKVLRDQLRDQCALGQSAADTVVLDQSKIGRLSRMDALQQQKMAESTLRSSENRLRRVMRALAKIESGDYGFCDECGDSIVLPRLQVQPETPLCLGCQSKTEA